MHHSAQHSIFALEPFQSASQPDRPKCRYECYRSCEAWCGRQPKALLTELATAGVCGADIKPAFSIPAAEAPATRDAGGPDHCLGLTSAAMGVAGVGNRLAWGGSQSLAPCRCLLLFCIFLLFCVLSVLRLSPRTYLSTLRLQSLLLIMAARRRRVRQQAQATRQPAAAAAAVSQADTQPFWPRASWRRRICIASDIPAAGRGRKCNCRRVRRLQVCSKQASSEFLPKIMCQLSWWCAALRWAW